MNLTLTLTTEEVNTILQTLGNLPTASGVYPLAMKVKMQAEAQLPAQEQETEE